MVLGGTAVPPTAVVAEEAAADCNPCSSNPPYTRDNHKNGSTIAEQPPQPPPPNNDDTKRKRRKRSNKKKNQNQVAAENGDDEYDDSDDDEDEDKYCNEDDNDEEFARKYKIEIAVMDPLLPSTPPPPPSVDRRWLHKLLEKHGVTNLMNDPAAGQKGGSRPLVVLAPMVDQSDLPFRLLCRNYTIPLCFTPMIHSKLYMQSPRYRDKFNLHSHQTPPSRADRPLIAQLCGHDPVLMVQTALALQHHCDAIDINCGCPQGIAKRGKYGAFLLEQPHILLTVVRTLVQYCRVPICVKVRLLPDGSSNNNNKESNLQHSLALYRALRDAGMAMLTVHGRTRHQKGADTGAADWKAIQQIVQELGKDIPILANGSIDSLETATKCLQVTAADGVMTAEAILEYPPLFSYPPLSLPAADPTLEQNDTQAAPAAAVGRPVGRVDCALEYLDLVKQYPPHRAGQGSALKCPRMHIHRMLHADLQASEALREAVIQAKTLDELHQAVLQVQAYQTSIAHDVSQETLSWYVRHRAIKQRRQGNNNNDSSVILWTNAQEKRMHESTVSSTATPELAADGFGQLFQDEDDEYDECDECEEYKAC